MITRKIVYFVVSGKFIFWFTCRSWLFRVALGAAGAYVSVITTTCDLAVVL